jgi:hypothetical protein
MQQVSIHRQRRGEWWRRLWTSPRIQVCKQSSLANLFILPDSDSYARTRLNTFSAEIKDRHDMFQGKTRQSRIQKTIRTVNLPIEVRRIRDDQSLFCSSTFTDRLGLWKVSHLRALQLTSLSCHKLFGSAFRMRSWQGWRSTLTYFSSWGSARFRIIERAA